jgi:hypothetical protein
MGLIVTGKWSTASFAVEANTGTSTTGSLRPNLNSGVKKISL